MESEWVQRAGIAQIHIPFTDDLIADGSRDQEVINHAADSSRLQGGSLVAAGGWCAPSETLYELGGILADANAGLVSLPEVQAKRGRLRFTEGPDFTAIYNATGFMQTEAQAIAGSGFTKPTGEAVPGTEKPFYRVPCQNFDEKRAETRVSVSSRGSCRTTPTGVDRRGCRARPDRALPQGQCPQHQADGRRVRCGDQRRARCVGDHVGLECDDIQLTDYRYLNRTPDKMTLEVLAPTWLKAVFRSDLAQRAGLTPDEGYKITDQQIDAWFAARNAKAQWVYDWQDAFTGVSGGFGGATAITTWPDTVDLLIYAAGTFVRARGEVINLEGIYDSTNLKVNDFHRLFVEEKLLVIRRRWKARRLTIPLALNCATGIARELDGDGKIVPATP
ncbi:major capsid protein [Prescottella agglutinans]|uniref:Uncharacterized protein n=1 Tax=Prescottella agglutinans TaxID=1644129 RepID=A0ABT6MKH0_9NOCA|nr:major capsid protein [Prescottella agglutinans]MDH6284813.1 hypothetical protein [Prescottella agglutinans]